MEAAVEEIAGRALAAGEAAFGRGWRPARRATAPGRIELLGNHLDYNGGPVLAAAIDRFVVVLAGEASDGDGVRVVAADAPQFGAAALDPDALRDWRTGALSDPFDYVRGVIAATLARP